MNFLTGLIYFLSWIGIFVILFKITFRNFPDFKKYPYLRKFKKGTFVLIYEKEWSLLTIGFTKKHVRYLSTFKGSVLTLKKDNFIRAAAYFTDFYKDPSEKFWEEKDEPLSGIYLFITAERVSDGKILVCVPKEEGEMQNFFKKIYE